MYRQDYDISARDIEGSCDVRTPVSARRIQVGLVCSLAALFLHLLSFHDASAMGGIMQKESREL